MSCFQWNQHEINTNKKMIVYVVKKYSTFLWKATSPTERCPCLEKKTQNKIKNSRNQHGFVVPLCKTSIKSTTKQPRFQQLNLQSLGNPLYELSHNCLTGSACCWGLGRSWWKKAGNQLFAAVPHLVRVCCPVAEDFCVWILACCTFAGCFLLF